MGVILILCLSQSLRTPLYVIKLRNAGQFFPQPFEFHRGRTFLCEGLNSPFCRSHGLSVRHPEVFTPTLTRGEAIEQSPAGRRHAPRSSGAIRLSPSLISLSTHYRAGRGEAFRGCFHFCSSVCMSLRLRCKSGACFRALIFITSILIPKCEL